MTRIYLRSPNLVAISGANKLRFVSKNGSEVLFFNRYIISVSLNRQLKP